SAVWFDVDVVREPHHLAPPRRHEYHLPVVVREPHNTDRAIDPALAPAAAVVTNLRVGDRRPGRMAADRQLAACSGEIELLDVGGVANRLAVLRHRSVTGGNRRLVPGKPAVRARTGHVTGLHRSEYRGGTVERPVRPPVVLAAHVCLELQVDGS